MTRYFFDILADEISERDETGLELPGLSAARQEAVKAAVGLLAENGHRADKHIVIVVRDGLAPVGIEVEVKLRVRG